MAKEDYLFVTCICVPATFIFLFVISKITVFIMVRASFVVELQYGMQDKGKA